MLSELLIGPGSRLGPGTEQTQETFKRYGAGLHHLFEQRFGQKS